jgi:hypothetical protein
MGSAHDVRYSTLYQPRMPMLDLYTDLTVFLYTINEQDTHNVRKEGFTALNMQEFDVTFLYYPQILRTSLQCSLRDNTIICSFSAFTVFLDEMQ